MKINKINSFLVSYTSKCNLSCEHCIVDCGPERNEKLGFEKVLSFVRDLKNFEVTNVNFTGGECTLFFDELLKIISVGKKQGISSGIITNGFWGYSKKNAERMVSGLAKAGLKELWISVDEFHLKFIPMKSIFNIVDAVQKKKKKIKVYLKFAYSKNSSVLDFVKENSEYFKNLKKMPLTKDLFIATQPLIPLGRAFKNVPKQSYLVEHETHAIPCNFLGNPFLNFDGNAFCCCNASGLNNPFQDPFFLGDNSSSLEELVSVYQESLFVFYLRVKGPYFIEMLARKHKLKKVNKVKNLLSKYIGGCDFCVLNLSQYQKAAVDVMLLNEFNKDRKMQELAKKESKKFQIQGKESE